MRLSFLSFAFILLVAVCLGSSSSPVISQSDDVVVTTQHIDEVRSPRSLADSAKSCLSDNLCSTILDAVTAELGIPSNAIDIVNVANLLTGGPTSPTSEEAKYYLRAVPGQVICRVRMVTTSVVPASGDRASFFAMTAWPDQVQMYTWTPHQGTGGGRSWWEGDIFVTHVKAKLAARYIKAGKCSNFAAAGPNGVHFQCRGRDECGTKVL